MGSLRFGIHEILLPEGNIPDLAEMDPLIRSAVNFTAVSHMDQVLDKALCTSDEGINHALLHNVLPTEPREHDSVSIRQ